MTEPLKLHSTLRLSQAVISGAARHASAVYCMDDLTHYLHVTPKGQTRNHSTP